MRTTLTRKVLFERTSDVNKKRYENKKIKEAQRKILYDSVYAHYVRAKDGSWIKSMGFEDVAYVIKNAISLNAKYLLLGKIETGSSLENVFFLIAFNAKELFNHSEFCSERGFQIKFIISPKVFAKEVGI